jgi:hypothetical protein
MIELPLQDPVIQFSLLVAMALAMPLAAKRVHLPGLLGFRGDSFRGDRPCALHAAGQLSRGQAVRVACRGTGDRPCALHAGTGRARCMPQHDARPVPVWFGPIPPGPCPSCTMHGLSPRRPRVSGSPLPARCTACPRVSGGC